MTPQPQSNHYKHSMPQSPLPNDSYLACIICGVDLPPYNPRFLSNRPTWGRLNRARFGAENKHKKQNVVVPASEVEGTDLKNYPQEWMQLHRVVLHDLSSNKISISGISCGTASRCVPTDPSKARIAGQVRQGDRWNTKFEMVQMLDQHKEKSVINTTPEAAGTEHEPRSTSSDTVVGYPMHVHCWLLLDRVIGQERVTQNMSKFLQTVHSFWAAHEPEWKIRLGNEPPRFVPTVHGALDCCQGRALWEMSHSENGRRNGNWKMTYGAQRRRDMVIVWLYRQFRYMRMSVEPANPYRNPELDKLVALSINPKPKTTTITTITTSTRASTRARAKTHATASSPSSSPSSYMDIPLDIAMTIIKLVCGPPEDLAGIRDTQNLLRVFHWTMPDSYWIKRCRGNWVPDVLYERDDAITAGHCVDWGLLSLQLQEISTRAYWCCALGVCHRYRVLWALRGMKERFEGGVGSLRNGVEKSYDC
ncbi:hypothetical protein BJX70DRAFT_402723 [Aspergillus crustosus]